MPDANTAKIAALNDHARQTFRECRVVITQAVAELGKDDVDRILDKVRNYNDFTPDNDPFLEHDFGSIQFGENTIFWKIDYYDLDPAHALARSKCFSRHSTHTHYYVGGGILKPDTDYLDTNTAKLPSTK
jgi:hypothetical protein